MSTSVPTAAQALDPDQLMAAARAATGLEDFGPPEFRDGLERFLSSAVNDARLNAVGIASLAGLATGMLINRLRFTEDLRRHPEILEEAIEPPVVIVGLPRTGTTKLHRMIAVDPRLQSIRAWQTLNPAPFPPSLDSSGPDPRIAVAKQMDAMLEAMNPEILAGHAIRAEEVDEESSYLMEMSFEWILLAMRADLPSFQSWVKTRPAITTYRYLRQLLQYLQWQSGADRTRPFVLKSPLHIACLDALLEVFPGATLIHCHREPAEAVTSFMRLAELSRNLMYDTVDREAVGRWVLETLSEQVRHYLRLRDQLGSRADIVDAAFRTITQDAPAVIRAAYARRGWSLSDTTCLAMLDWEQGHPKDRFGKFTYDMARYGMTRADFDAAFAEYNGRFHAYL